MKFALSLVVPAVAVRVADVHPTVNMVLTNDGSMDASLAQNSRSGNVRAELANLVKSEEARHTSLVEGPAREPNVVRINYQTPHMMLAEAKGIVRESISESAPYEENEVGLNLMPAGGAADLASLFKSQDADFETQFRAGLHQSFLENAKAIRIRVRGGSAFAESEGDDVPVQVRLLPPRGTPHASFTEGDITEFVKRIDGGDERAIGSLINLVDTHKQAIKDSGAVARCAGVMQSESSSEVAKGACGSLITHLTNTPVASSTMDASTGGNGHVTVVLPSPSRVYR